MWKTLVCFGGKGSCFVRPSSKITRFSQNTRRHSVFFRHICRLGQNCFALLAIFNWQTISWPPTWLGFSAIRRSSFVGKKPNLHCQQERDVVDFSDTLSYSWGITVFPAPVFHPGVCVWNCVIRCICFRCPDHLAPPPPTTHSTLQPFDPLCCCCLFASSSCRVTFRVPVCVNLAPLI